MTMMFLFIDKERGVLVILFHLEHLGISISYEVSDAFHSCYPGR